MYLLIVESVRFSPSLLLNRAIQQCFNSSVCSALLLLSMYTLLKLSFLMLILPPALPCLSSVILKLNCVLELTCLNYFILDCSLIWTLNVTEKWCVKNKLLLLGFSELAVTPEFNLLCLRFPFIKHHCNCASNVTLWCQHGRQCITFIGITEPHKNTLNQTICHTYCSCLCFMFF